jgi:hypothetical protein
MYEHRVFSTGYAPVTAHHPGAEQRRLDALAKWTAGLNELAADGWEVIAAVPPSLAGPAGEALLLRRRVADAGEVTG